MSHIYILCPVYVGLSNIFLIYKQTQKKQLYEINFSYTARFKPVLMPQSDSQGSAWAKLFHRVVFRSSSNELQMNLVQFKKCHGSWQSSVHQSMPSPDRTFQIVTLCARAHTHTHWHPDKKQRGSTLIGSCRKDWTTMHSTDSPASLAESVHAQLTDAAAGAVAATTQRPSMSALSPDWCFIIQVHTKLDSDYWLHSISHTHTHSSTQDKYVALSRHRHSRLTCRHIQSKSLVSYVLKC